MQRTKLLSASLILCLSCTAGAAQPGSESRPRGNGAVSDAVQYSVLSLAEAEYLRFVREEEKLARDVYLSLYDLWQLDIFENISASEQNHIDAMKNLLDKYRVPDPAQPSRGVFTNSELQAAYDALIARGKESLMDALYVGGYIEELDMRDLEEAKASTSRADILNVYDNLLRGSRNHLRAFVRQIESRGEAYEAQVIPQDQVDAIVDSPMERG